MMNLSQVFNNDSTLNRPAIERMCKQFSKVIVLEKKSSQTSRRISIWRKSAASKRAYNIELNSISFFSEARPAQWEGVRDSYLDVILVYGNMIRVSVTDQRFKHRRVKISEKYTVSIILCKFRVKKLRNAAQYHLMRLYYNVIFAY